ncbi:MAG: hypothetical protein EXQ57_07000 [Bryobacterales bacterium]|nr:hypothetical protein [Bryobacterales bacterium]
MLLALFAIGSLIDALGGRVDRDAGGQITGLYLRASWVTDGDLLEIGRLPQLRRLDLSQTRITDQGMAYLKSATGLRDVNLAYAEKIGDPAHAVIKHWKNLQRLNLRGTLVSDETAAAAAALPDLEFLDIADSIVGDVGVDALTAARKLKTLAMGNTRISEAGFQSLRQFTTLSHLDLSGKRHGSPSKISQRGIEAIASLRQLRGLRLGHSSFPDKDLAVLATMPGIEELGLEFCPDVADGALRNLIGWKSLRRVDLHGTKVTAEGIAVLRQARPELRVLWE